MLKGALSQGTPQDAASAFITDLIDGKFKAAAAAAEVHAWPQVEL